MYTSASRWKLIGFCNKQNFLRAKGQEFKGKDNIIKVV